MAGIVALAFPASASFFFFLSGYVLSFVYLHNVQTLDKGAFFAARFARLYPLYLAVLTLDTPELLVTEVRRYGLNIGLTKTAEIYAANVLMVQVWNPSRLLRINLPSWSLCGEVFFYACFPLLGVLLWKLRGAWLWVAALTLYVGGQTLVWVMRRHLSLEMTLTLPPLHLSTFALGILMARGQTLQQKRNGKAPVRVSQVSTVLGCRSALFGGVHCWSPFLVYRLPTTTG
jgi:peptidoglycan/LPS O-acetylase OafA/YrhL